MYFTEYTQLRIDELSHSEAYGCNTAEIEGHSIALAINLIAKKYPNLCKDFGNGKQFPAAIRNELGKLYREAVERKKKSCEKLRAQRKPSKKPFPPSNPVIVPGK